MGDFAGGYSGVFKDDKSYSLCHPNEPNRPDCYRLVTVYKEPIGARKSAPSQVDEALLARRDAWCG